MKKLINSLIHPQALLGIPFAIIISLVLTQELSPSNQQMLARYGLDRGGVIAISAIVFWGAGALGYLIAQPFRISEKEFLMQRTKDEMAGLEIAEEDQEFLAQGIWEVDECINANPDFSKEKIIELTQRFQDPSVDKQKAMQDFQSAMRSSSKPSESLKDFIGIGEGPENSSALEGFSIGIEGEGQPTKNNKSEEG